MATLTYSHFGNPTWNHHAARGGWRPHTSRGGFFDFIYVTIDAIGTFMQNFIEIDRQKNQAFFI